MTKANETKLRATLGAVVAILIAYGPDLVTWLGSLDNAPKWVLLLAKGLGLLVGLCTTGRAVVLLNRFLPADIDATAIVGVVPSTEVPTKPVLVAVKGPPS
jgi:hypothetical protein